MNIFEYDGKEFDKKLDEIVSNINKSDFLQELKGENMKNNPKSIKEMIDKIKDIPEETVVSTIDKIEKETEHNKELIKKYPWLQIRNVWDNKPVEDCEFTWLDDLPFGWRKAFGLEMVEKLDQILRKANYQNKYRITQIKEKWGFLHWYDNGVPASIYEEYNNWLNKYEELSKHTCIMCGEKGELIDKGWIMPLCLKCKESEDINENYK
ncbi:MAG: hypothetical protein ACLTPN_00985 [Clostridia bacterium]